MDCGLPRWKMGRTQEIISLNGTISVPFFVDRECVFKLIVQQFVLKLATVWR